MVADYSTSVLNGTVVNGMVCKSRVYLKVRSKIRSFKDEKYFSPKMSESTGGKPSKDADMSIDIARRICMIQRMPKGKETFGLLLEIEDIKYGN